MPIIAKRAAVRGVHHAFSGRRIVVVVNTRRADGDPVRIGLSFALTGEVASPRRRAKPHSRSGATTSTARAVCLAGPSSS